MIEKTRNNFGVVTFEYGEEKYKINPTEITDFINPALLEKRAKLPNGALISAQQYIQEIFAPHIPYNGRMLLNTGASISVQQYIEEVLLCEGQEKYNGDINQILFNTTRNNTGVINADYRKIQEEFMQLKNQVDTCNQQSTMGSGPRR